MLAIRKCETDWICRSLTAPVSSRTINKIILITLAGRTPGAAAPPSRQADPKDQASSPITFIDPLPFLSNRPVPLTPKSPWRNNPPVPGNGPRPFPGTRFSRPAELNSASLPFAFGKTLVRGGFRAAPSVMGPLPKRRGTACSDQPGSSYSQIAVAKESLRRCPEMDCPFRGPVFHCPAELNSAFRQGFAFGKSRLYGASAPPHLRWGPCRNAGELPAQTGPVPLTPKSPWRNNPPAFRRRIRRAEPSSWSSTSAERRRPLYLIAHGVAVGPGVMDDQQIAGLHLRKHPVNGKLVAVFTQGAGHIVLVVAGGVLLPHDGVMWW